MTTSIHLEKRLVFSDFYINDCTYNKNVFIDQNVYTEANNIVRIY